MPALNVAFLVWCCSQLPLRNRRTTAVVCYWRPWERAVYSLAPSSKLNRRNKNSASSLTSATKCSLGVSALAEFRQWVSHVICEPPPEHVSGVRRCSVNKCLLHRYDDWSLGSQHLYFFKKKKKPGTAVHTCNPKARKQRQEDPWATASHFTWKTKETLGAVRVCPKVRKHTWHRPLASMHPYTCAHTHSHAHAEVHVWNTIPRPFKSEHLGMIPKILNFKELVEWFY